MIDTDYFMYQSKYESLFDEEANKNVSTDLSNQYNVDALAPFSIKKTKLMQDTRQHMESHLKTPRDRIDSSAEYKHNSERHKNYPHFKSYLAKP